MRKVRYSKNVNCPMTIEMFQRIVVETDKREMPFSEYIREALELKLNLDSKDGKK
jgi:hypothetical protein